MTIICAWRGPKSVFIGADSLACNGNYKLPGEVKKWIFCKKNRVAVASAGWYRTSTLLQENKESLLQRCSIEERVRLLKETLISAGYEPKKAEDGGPSVYGDTFLAVQDGKVYDIDSAFSPMECPYAARGSGMDYALGALYSLGDWPRLGGINRINLALRAACELDSPCGGSLLMEEI